MRKNWENLDLAGGGLQSANLLLARRLKRRALAYAWWLLSPIGAHRFYLNDSHAWLYPAASLLALLLALFNFTGAWVIAGMIVIAALYDLVWIDRRLTAINKQIRMDVCLRSGATPPRGFRGRFSPESGKNGNEDREASFIDQEAMLRRLTREKTERRGEK